VPLSIKAAGQEIFRPSYPAWEMASSAGTSSRDLLLRGILTLSNGSRACFTSWPMPEVIDAYLFGATVHAVFLADGGERAFAESLIAALQSQGFADVSAVRVEPTIDDVFVSLISSQRATPSEYTVRSPRHRAPRRKAEWTVRRLAVTD
jgi:hypothetical protein